MARRKRKAAGISVFKGREAKLNKAIFYTLALKGPLTIYDLSKQIRRQRIFRRKFYSVTNRRVRALEKQGYVEKVGTKKTLAGFTAGLYQLAPRGYLAILLSQTSLENLVDKADETTVLELLGILGKRSDMYVF